MVWQVDDIFGEAELPDAQELIAQGTKLARNCQVVSGAFLKSTGFASEAAYKRAMAGEGYGAS